MALSNSEHILNTARDVLLKAMPDVLAIYIYGSFARSEERPDSDVDLAVLLPPGKDIPDILAVLGELSQRVDRNVDLVNLRKVGDVLRREVLADGRTLFVSQPEALLVWEASAMSRYARHREEIRDILEDFSRTGIGYGS